MLFLLLSPNMPGFVTKGLRREVHENCVLLGHYAAISGNSLPAFRDNLSGPIFKGQESKKRASKKGEMGPIVCP